VAVLFPYAKAQFSLRYETFHTALAGLGYVDGRDISMDVRWADNKLDRLNPLAAELVAGRPEVLVTATSAGVIACRKATSTIPIVFAAAFNPVEQGFVSSLRRPGGNVTGVLVYSDLAAKLAEVARDVFPSKRRLALLLNDADPAHKFVLNTFESSARRFKFDPLIVRVTRLEDFERAFGELAHLKADLVLVPLLSLFTGNSKRLAQLSIAARLPLLSSELSMAENGTLLSYGTQAEENYRRAAVLVDKILRGTKPSDLPVDQPERFLLVINLRTAQAIGVTLSRDTLARADRLIQ
jgi:putative tryptophan/tyrosine transport system substrate-binding protein